MACGNKQILLTGCSGIQCSSANHIEEVRTGIYICPKAEWSDMTCHSSLGDYFNRPFYSCLSLVGCCCWSQSQPCLRASAGQGTPWTSRMSMSRVQYLTQGHFDTQLSPARSRDLNQRSSFRSLVDLLYPLSYSRPYLCYC